MYAQDEIYLICHNLVLKELIGSLIWLTYSTHPYLYIAMSLLSQYNTHPTPNLLEAGKYILQYLHSMASYGISFSTHPDTNLSSFIGFHLSHSNLASFTNANWGPQNASKPLIPAPEIYIASTHSLFSQFTFHSGGPIS